MAMQRVHPPGSENGGDDGSCAEWEGELRVDVVDVVGVIVGGDPGSIVVGVVVVVVIGVGTVGFVCAPGVHVVVLVAGVVMREHHRPGCDPAGEIEPQDGGGQTAAVAVGGQGRPQRRRGYVSRFLGTLFGSAARCRFPTPVRVARRHRMVGWPSVARGAGGVKAWSAPLVTRRRRAKEEPPWSRSTSHCAASRRIESSSRPRRSRR